MKVVCIDKTTTGMDKNDLHLLTEGSVYAVIYDGYLLEDGTRIICGHGYGLSGVVRPDGKYPGFEYFRFIPLSNICETEFERNYNKELV
jgi:hypothetical protein